MYTQYCAIRNGLIRNSTEIFTNFKKRVLKIFGIRNKFFSLMEIKKPTILKTLEIRNQYTVNVYRDLQGLYRDFCVQGF